MMSVTLEIYDRVYQMFESFWPGDDAFFGDMADDDGGGRSWLHGLEEFGGASADLSGGAGFALDFI